MKEGVMYAKILEREANGDLLVKLDYQYIQLEKDHKRSTPGKSIFVATEIQPYIEHSANKNV